MAKSSVASLWKCGVSRTSGAATSTLCTPNGVEKAKVRARAAIREKSAATVSTTPCVEGVVR